jgi:hypothetical protein
MGGISSVLAPWVGRKIRINKQAAGTTKHKGGVKVSLGPEGSARFVVIDSPAIVNAIECITGRSTYNN